MTMYFNKNWQPDHGGSLQLWDKRISKCISIAPLFNRCVLFEVSRFAYHSIENVNVPAGEYRRGLNYYFYSEAGPPGHKPSSVHDTVFFSHPEESLSYRKRQISTNFPFQFIDALSYRSEPLMSFKNKVKQVMGKSTRIVRPTSCSQELLKRWYEFNSLA